MNQQIRAPIEAKPLGGFAFKVTDGRSIDVPHPDHVMVGKFAVAIEDDDGVVRILGDRNISGLTVPTG